MKTQVINILLDDIEEIEDVRGEYAPDRQSIKPHVTLVYPFTVEDQQALDKHIRTCIADISPFTIQLKGLRRSEQDFYLYLLVQEGKESVELLEQRLNTGILQGFRNPRIPRYIPHVTLAVFEDQARFDEALGKIQEKEIDVSIKVDGIQLLRISENHEVLERKDYLLSGP